MMDAGWPEGRALDGVTQHEARVADLTRRLQHAERAVGRANSAEAADAAHRRAEALLLQLEGAEHALLNVAARPAPTEAVLSTLSPRRRRGAEVIGAQEGLFDID